LYQTSPSALCHSLDQNDTRYYGVAGKVALEKEMVGCKHTLGNRVLLINFQELIQENERISVGD